MAPKCQGSCSQPPVEQSFLRSAEGQMEGCNNFTLCSPWQSLSLLNPFVSDRQASIKCGLIARERLEEPSSSSMLPICSCLRFSTHSALWFLFTAVCCFLHPFPSISHSFTLPPTACYLSSPCAFKASSLLVSPGLLATWSLGKLRLHLARAAPCASLKISCPGRQDAPALALIFCSIFPFPSPFLISCPLTLIPLPLTLFPLFSPSFLTMLPCVYRLQPVLALLFFTLFTQGENCPATCLCPDPHTVDCSGRGLSRLPDEIPLDVRRLLLANNWIPLIPSDFLVLYSDLVYLDLRNNSLSYIEPGTLSSSSRLVFLDLGCNNLTEIPKGTFGESRSLIKLRLGNNPHLSMVNEDAFVGLTSLRELELERNALSGLQVGALSQLPSLRVVRLEGNPWVCNCNFANLFTWLGENSHKLPNGESLNLASTIVACWTLSHCCINVTVWHDSLLFILLQIKQGTSSTDLNLALSPTPTMTTMNF